MNIVNDTANIVAIYKVRMNIVIPTILAMLSYIRRVRLWCLSIVILLLLFQILNTSFTFHRTIYISYCAFCFLLLLSPKNVECNRLYLNYGSAIWSIVVQDVRISTILIVLNNIVNIYSNFAKRSILRNILLFIMSLFPLIGICQGNTYSSPIYVYVLALIFIYNNDNYGKQAINLISITMYLLYLIKFNSLYGMNYNNLSTIIALLMNAILMYFVVLKIFYTKCRYFVQKYIYQFLLHCCLLLSVTINFSAAYCIKTILLCVFMITFAIHTYNMYNKAINLLYTLCLLMYTIVFGVISSELYVSLYAGCMIVPVYSLLKQHYKYTDIGILKKLIYIILFICIISFIVYNLFYLDIQYKNIIALLCSFVVSYPIYFYRYKIIMATNVIGRKVRGILSRVNRIHVKTIFSKTWFLVLLSILLSLCICMSSIFYKIEL